MRRVWRRYRCQLLWVLPCCLALPLVFFLFHTNGRQDRKHVEDSPRQPLSQPIAGPRILCWALVRLETVATKGKALQDTWTKRCDKVLFFSSTLDKIKTSWKKPHSRDDASTTINATTSATTMNYSTNTITTTSNTNSWRDVQAPGASAHLVIPTITLDVPEGREHLTAKAILASVYSWRVYGKVFDWFLKSDDDTYIVMENLRTMLRSHDPDTPVYFGYRFKPYTPQGYMSGGAGYVLSREALRRLVVEGVLGKLCGPFTGVEDLDIGRCLYTVGVKAMDSVDDLGLEKFHPLNFFAYFGDLQLPTWTGEYAFHPFRRGFACCSNRSISFHYMRTHDMYMMEFLIYHLQH